MADRKESPAICRQYGIPFGEPRFRHVVLFARVPRFGTVKSRLARDIGKLAAYRFYRETLAQVSGRLARDGRWQLWIALTPDRLVRAGDVGPLRYGGGGWPDGAVLIPQGDGDLGTRMTRCLRALPPGPAVIVGSDIPEVAPDDLEEAFQMLGRKDAVFGPAPDGGYWLVGLRRSRPVPCGFMQQVRWSTAHALEDTVAGLAPEMTVGLLGHRDDIDDGEAYRLWRRR